MCVALMRMQEMERERALRHGYVSPVWPTLQQTHNCYATCTNVGEQ